MDLPFSRKLQTAAVASVVGLFIVEIALRVSGIPTFHKAHSSPPQFQFMKDETTGRLFYVNRLSSSIVFEYDSNPRGYFGVNNSVDQSTNSSGFRGREFVVPKPARTLRILFLGDSFTFGEGVRFEDTLPSLTQTILADRLSDKRLRVETYNLGVGGYNTADEVFLLKKLGLELQPDYIVLVYNLNDAEPPLFGVTPDGRPIRRDREASIPEGLDEHRPPGSWIFRFHVVSLVWKAFTTPRASAVTEDYYRSLYRDDAMGWKNARRALRELAHISKARRIPTLVALYPVLFKLNDKHPFLSLYEGVEKCSRAEHLQTVALFPAFKGRRADRLWVHPTDQHPNETAHPLAARYLAETLLSDPDFQNVVSDICAAPRRGLGNAPWQAAKKNLFAGPDGLH